MDRPAHTFEDPKHTTNACTCAHTGIFSTARTNESLNFATIEESPLALSTNSTMPGFVQNWPKTRRRKVCAGERTDGVNLLTMDYATTRTRTAATETLLASRTRLTLVCVCVCVCVCVLRCWSNQLECGRWGLSWLCV